MNLDFTWLFDTLFPPTNDEETIAECTDGEFQRKLDITSRGGITSLSSFRDPHIRAAIHLNKFHAHPQAQRLLTALLTKYLLTLPSKTYLLLPVPLSSQRERERGYNQVTVIAQKVQLQLPSFKVAGSTLRRIRHTPPQTSLSKQERQQNMHGAFAVYEADALRICGAHLILLDDVSTTGATLQEAKKALLPYAPASVLCLALSS